MTANLSLRPSAAHSWMVCTARPQFLADHAAELPDTSQSFAKEGTLAHEVAQAMLTAQPYSCDAEMAKHVKGYVDRCMECITDFEAVLWGVEKEVYPYYGVKRPGRVDFFARHDEERRLIVRDLKYGEGVMVEADGNVQLAIYAFSLLQDVPEADRPLWTVVIEVDQPRGYGDETIRTFSCSLAELAELLKPVDEAIAVIRAGKGKFAPSEATCQFCPGKAICPARGSNALVVVPEEIVAALGGLPKPSGLTIDQLQRVLVGGELLTKWIADCKKYAFDVAQAGKLPGFKIVAGRGSRGWANEEEAAKVLEPFLGPARWTKRELQSPAQIEKLLKDPRKPVTENLEKRLEELIVKSSGKPTLVPDSDPRPALSDTLESFIDESLL